MNKHLNIQTATLLGVLANFSFLLFIFFGLCYYAAMSKVSSDAFVTAGEYGVMPFEIIGFVLLFAYTIGYVVLLNGNKLFKIIISIYCIAELVIMLCDFGFILNSVYNRQSVVLIVAHIMFSVIMFYLYSRLDYCCDGLRLAVLVAMMIAIILPIPLWCIFAFQIYYSVLANSIALIWLNGYMYSKLSSGDMVIDALTFDDLTDAVTHDHYAQNSAKGKDNNDE